MTEEMAGTIAQIRALVGERQRYDEWLTALEAKRAETPARVFDRVHGDYLARRDAVVTNLLTHVGTLESLERDLNTRIGVLETRLAEREDERTEAMLRTAVGEFDSQRWEATRHDVEASIAQLGQDRASLAAEAEDTRTLLASARLKPSSYVAEPALPAANAFEGSAVKLASAANLVITEPQGTPAVAAANAINVEAPATPLAGAAATNASDFVGLGNGGTNVDNASNAPSNAAATATSNVPTNPTPIAPIDAFFETPAVAQAIAPIAPTPTFAPRPSHDNEADIEVAFAVSDEAVESLGVHSSHDYPPPQLVTDSHTSSRANDIVSSAPAHAPEAVPGATVPEPLDHIDVFGDPTPRSAGAIDHATRQHEARGTDPRAAEPRSEGRNAWAPDSTANDVFDDLAFLRSVTEQPGSGPGSVPRSNASGDQTKTLRCTECGTMNFPTEWYCERCGGELAAF